MIIGPPGNTVSESGASTRGSWWRGLATTLALMLFTVSGGCGNTGEEYAQEVLHALDQGKVIGTRGTMETVGRALSVYQLERGEYPRAMSMQGALAELSPAYLRGSTMTDAWGNAFEYRSDGESFTLTAPGFDGRVGTSDDIEMVDGTITKVPAASPGQGGH